jgi:integrase/recombinase XerD
MSEKPISPLRQRMLEDMNVRRFTPDTQREYVRAVKRLAAFLNRSPDTATAEELRAFQVQLTETGVKPPTLNTTAALLLQGDAGPAGDDAASRVRLRAAQAAAGALA